MRSSTFSKALGILAIAILVGGLIGWWASRNPAGQPLPSSPQLSDPETTQIPEPTQTTPVVEPTVAMPMPDEPETVSTNNFDDPAMWEEKLDEILGSDTIAEDKKGEQLLEMMAKVGTEAQTELAGHVVNLLEDDQFHKTGKYLTNAEVPEAVSSIFMNDLYNRDETVKLPLLLEVARNDKHVLRDEARDLLELYVEEDHGTNWVEWEAATKKYLKENGAEATDAPATGDAN